jgi:DNA-binding HxlR family transcriptional regulator
MPNPTPNPTLNHVLSQSCSTRLVLELIDNKWTVLVVHALAGGTKRYKQLKVLVHGITDKMLAQTLRQLEYDGLITRTVYPVVPPHVEYNLTPLGQTLIEPLSALCGWAERYLGEVEAARRAADERELMRA